MNQIWRKGCGEKDRGSGFIGRLLCCYSKFKSYRNLKIVIFKLNLKIIDLNFIGKYVDSHKEYIISNLIFELLLYFLSLNDS
jgi:hypothetical protein